MVLAWPRSHRSSVVFMILAASGFLAGAAGAARSPQTSEQVPPRTSNSKPTALAARPAQAKSEGTGSGQVSWFAGGEELYVPPYYDPVQDATLSSPPPSARAVPHGEYRILHLRADGCQRATIANCYTNEILSVPARPVGSARSRKCGPKSGKRPTPLRDSPPRVAARSDKGPLFGEKTRPSQLENTREPRMS